MLSILVCVKQVPDVDQMKMDPETGTLVRTRSSRPYSTLWMPTRSRRLWR